MVVFASDARACARAFQGQPWAGDGQCPESLRLYCGPLFRELCPQLEWFRISAQVICTEPGRMQSGLGTKGEVKKCVSV
eukprot:172737-Rhodomonas_salina.1